MTDTPQLENKASFSSARLKRVAGWLQTQVDRCRLSGASVLISKKGEPSSFHAFGVAGESDGAARPFDRDTLVRLYSMTKPVTTVAALVLFEQGKFQLDDPVWWYLPAFAHLRVWTGEGALDNAEALDKHTDALHCHISVRHLMTHTSGLTYSFMNTNAVDKYYRDNALEFPGASESLENLVNRLAEAPLMCQPGTAWNYSVATDVLGRLVEIWSGQGLDEYFKQHIFEPLGMSDTGFHVEAANVHRFADLYGPAAGGDLGSLATASTTDIPDQQYKQDPPIPLDVQQSSAFNEAPILFSGGGGLVGSIDDYGRFCQMLLNKGELGTARLLGRKTVGFMMQNQLPDNGDMASMGQAVWSETSYQGIGFALGGAVVLDPVKAGILTSAGEYHWGGAASTFFWIDPAEEVAVVFLTQLYPSSTYPLRKELRTAVYQALL